MHVDEWELNARHRKYAQIAAAQADDAERVAELESLRVERANVLPVGLELLARLQETRDLESIRRDLDVWARQKATGFGGFGMMLLNQLTKSAPDKNEVSSLVADALSVPADTAEAAQKISNAVAYTETVKKGGAPAPKRIPFVLSYFWWMQQPSAWPCLWHSMERSLVSHLGWLAPNTDLAAFYLDIREVVLGLGDSPENVEFALHWFDDHRFVGLDPSLVDRSRRALDLRALSPDSVGYASEDDKAAAEVNARALVADPQLLGTDLEPGIAAALGRSVKVQKPRLEPRPGLLRADSWVDWRVADSPVDVAVRVWVTAEGVAVGLHPGLVRDSGRDAVAADLRNQIPDAMQLFRIREAGIGGRDHEDGEPFVGRWFEGQSALDRQDFRNDVLGAVTDLRPVVDHLVRRATGTLAAEPVAPDTDLAALVDRFVEERHYPSEKDVWHRAERETMAELLAADQLPLADITELRSIWNSNRYGNPGPQSALNTTLRDAEPATLEAFLDHVSYLLWGQDDVETRIDRLLDPNDLGTRGLGESVVMKLLAIAHPDRFLPVFPYTGDMGKIKMMKLIGLEPPDASLSRGERQVAANDIIRHRLDPFFPGDPWGQGQFLYWLNTQAERPPDQDTDILGSLAEDLLVKKDFFEGYRPEGGADGQLTYRLVPGPLALLAERAQGAPGIEHIMVIDEINRANLPKVLGELLFLLEYREQRVPTLYRAEEAFELPPDLLFIGTMNTADRSIALIDAALRRRFYFIPFFPDSGPMADLLDDWLDRHKEPAWVGEMVKMVNRELIEDLGGPHLQIGPSYFMQRGLTDERLKRIWTYSVFPFIEDQLFGDADRLQKYEYALVRARFKQSAGGVQLAEGDVDELTEGGQQ